MTKKIGFDIGYSTVKVITPDGEYKSEEAVIAINPADNTVVACGREAVALNIRVPGSVKLIHPFSGEMTPDVSYVYAYFSYMLDNLKIKNCRALISFSGAHDDETENAYVKGIQNAGIGTVSVIDPVYAAAQGCTTDGISNSAVINIGASVTDMGCFFMGQSVAQRSNSFAGNAFDRAVMNAVMNKYRYKMTSKEAEKAKLQLLSLTRYEGRTVECDAIKAPYGLPKKLTLNESDIKDGCEAVFDNLCDEIIGMIRALKVEPDKIILTGGTASLDGLKEALSFLLLLPIEVCEEPQYAVIRGIKNILDKMK